MYALNEVSFTDELTESELKELFRQSILGEVYTTPKPGLVDLKDSGAHRDMDVSTFEASTEAIVPYLCEMFYMGRDWKQTPEELFAEIRKTGRKAEWKMYEATGGVNTHKGLIFTMGILAAAAGYERTRDGEFVPEEILKFSSRMTAVPLEKEFTEMASREPVTHGEKLYHNYQERGIRGEAQKGFPVIRIFALPLMRKYRAMGADANRTNISVLLRIISKLTDTNVWSRSSSTELWWLQDQADKIMRHGGAFTQTGMAATERLNRSCIYRNISPGGAADLLAATLFLCNLEQA